MEAGPSSKERTACVFPREMRVARAKLGAAAQLMGVNRDLTS